MQIDIRSDIRTAERTLNAQQRKHIPKATSRAMNTTIRTVRTEAKRSISKKMGLPQKRVTDSLRTAFSSKSNLIATLTATGRPIKLIYFRATRQLKKGVKSAAYGANRLYRGAFITQVGSHKGAFTRKSAARLPIKELYGPSVPDTMADNEVQRSMQSKGKDTFLKQFKRNIGRLVK